MSGEYDGDAISDSELFFDEMDERNFLGPDELDVDGFGNCYSDADPGL